MEITIYTNPEGKPVVTIKGDTTRSTGYDNESPGKIAKAYNEIMAELEKKEDK